MIHGNHKIGALAELRCAAELIQRDWHVAFPFVHQSEVDMIAFRGNRFVTIQVKSAKYIRDKNPEITCRFDKYLNVDFIISYDVINRRWFIFPSEELKGRRMITLSPNKYMRNCDNWELIR
tara:strand:+ start:3208 stop:3570 length:363 start_codon:yes stop_codon:yes gene_type:complete